MHCAHPLTAQLVAQGRWANRDMARLAPKLCLYLGLHNVLTETQKTNQTFQVRVYFNNFPIGMFECQSGCRYPPDSLALHG